MRHANVFANLQLQQLSGRAEHSVASEMVVDIIGGFESTEVDHHEYAAFLLALGVGQGAPQLTVETPQIHQPGPLVG